MKNKEKIAQLVKKANTSLADKEEFLDYLDIIELTHRACEYLFFYTNTPVSKTSVSPKKVHKI